eukprot:scpid22330/ scgid9810/ Uncharacterized protein K02A2.6
MAGLLPSLTTSSRSIVSEASCLTCKVYCATAFAWLFRPCYSLRSSRSCTMVTKVSRRVELVMVARYLCRQYLITVDYFSRYIDVACLSSTTSRAVITHLKSIFAAHGYPDIFVSDNGPQFASDAFAQFMSSCNITHRTSSPKHPQSNGEAERAVQTAKRLIRAPGDLQQSLLAYRSTPLANGYSPAELLYGRRLRTNLPCPPDLLQP